VQKDGIQKGDRNSKKETPNTPCKYQMTFESYSNQIGSPSCASFGLRKSFDAFRNAMQLVASVCTSMKQSSLTFFEYRRGKGEREERDVALRNKKREMSAGRWGDGRLWPSGAEEREMWDGCEDP